MHVLVCEDDPAARFVARRWLSTALGCTVTDCEDGVQALALLAARPFDLAVIDIDLPRLSGIEVVEAIRDYQDTQDLPVVILSNERRQDVVRTLVRLGVSAYLLKPLRAQTVYERIGPLLATRRRRRTTAAGGTPQGRLGPDNPALIVDGDANFRHVFTSVGGTFGPIVVADSGAAALASYRAAPLDLVFIGDGLGLVAHDVLIRKIRDAGGPGLFVVRVGDGSPAAGGLAVYDAQMPRSFIPDTLAMELRRFARTTGPLSVLEDVAPNFAECLVTAVPQVLGMMGGVDVVVAQEPPATLGPAIVSAVTIDVDGRMFVDLGIVLPRPAAQAVSGALLGSPPEEVDDEACQSTVNELANMVSGRLDAWLKAREQTSHCTLPAARTVEGDALPPIAPEDGLERWFTLEGVGHPVLLRALARPRPTS